jgi:hypothetical protein
LINNSNSIINLDSRLHVHGKLLFSHFPTILINQKRPEINKNLSHRVNLKMMMMMMILQAAVTPECVSQSFQFFISLVINTSSRSLEKFTFANTYIYIFFIPRSNIDDDDVDERSNDLSSEGREWKK